MASTEWVRVRQQQLMVQDMYDEYAETYDEELCGKGGLGYRTPKLLEVALLSRAEKPAPAPSLPSATTASATTSPPRASAPPPASGVSAVARRRRSPRTPA